MNHPSIPSCLTLAPLSGGWFFCPPDKGDLGGLFQASGKKTAPLRGGLPFGVLLLPLIRGVSVHSFNLMARSHIFRRAVLVRTIP